MSAPPAAQGAIGISDLAAAGLGVVADADHLDPLVAVDTSVAPTPLRLLKDQADAMLLEASAGQGMLGSELDRLVPPDPGLPPPSYLVAGWVSAAGSPGSDLALRVMGVQDWKHAPSIVFPELVLTLYAADATRFADALANAADTPTGSTTQAGFVRPGDGVAPVQLVVMRPTTTGICSKVQGFVNSTVSAVFDALGHLEAPHVPSTGSGILGWFGQGLQAAFDLAAGVVNGLIDAGRFLVVNGIKMVTQPILDQIAKVAAVLAVAASVVSLLRPWTVRTDASPPQTRKAVGDEAGLPGTVSATVDLGGLDQWPADVEDCAQQAGVPLPPLKPVGAPITWTIDQSPGDLVTENAGRATVLDENAQGEAGYATTQESVDVAKGDAFEGTMKAHASIRRKEIADLQTRVEQLLFAQIPSLVQAILVPIVKPAIEAVLGALPALLDSNGYASVVVVYHEPNDTTTTAPTSAPPDSVAPAGPIDPCSLITPEEAAAALGADTGPGEDSPEPTGGRCIYSSGSGGSIIIGVIVGPPLGGKDAFEQSEAQTQANAAKNNAPAGTFDVVGGIGDGAFATQGGPFASVTFYKGNTTVTLIVTFQDPATPTPTGQAHALAVAAAGRM